MHQVLDRFLDQRLDQAATAKDFDQLETLVDEFDHQVGAEFLSELARHRLQADDPSADPPETLPQPPLCPHCGSDRSRALSEPEQIELQTTHGTVVLPRQPHRCRDCGSAFSPELDQLGLPNRVRLSHKTARRIAREASVQSFQLAAEAINEDWNTAYHPKQIQRYANQIGQHFRDQHEPPGQHG
jgi:hypothetical protein